MVIQKTSNSSIKPIPSKSIKPPQTHLIRRGETLSGLALRYHCSVADLLKKNPQIDNPDLIFAGQTLRLPELALGETAKDAGRAAASGQSKKATRAAHLNQDRVIALGAEQVSNLVARDSVKSTDQRVDDNKSLGLTGLLASNRVAHETAQAEPSGSATASAKARKTDVLPLVQKQLQADQDPKQTTRGASARIHQALDRFDVNEAEIERALGHRSSAEIAQIKKDFLAETGQPLEKTLGKKLDKTELRRAQLLMQGQDKFLPDRDAEMLDIAMRGVGTDERLVLDTLYGKSASERQDIAKAYQQRTGNALEDVIRSEHSGRDEILALAVLKRGRIDEADQLQGAMVGFGADSEAIFATLQNKTPEQLSKIQKDYHARYGEDLSTALNDQLSRGDKVRAQALLQSGSMSTADSIREEVAGLWSNDGKILKTLEGLDKNARSQLVDEYNSKYGSLDNALKDSLSKSAYTEAKTLIEKGELSPAEKINRAMRGLGTDNEMIFSTLQGLSSQERQNLKQDYQSKYGREIEKDLRADLSGLDQERALLYLDKGKPDLAEAINLEVRDGGDPQKLHSLLQEASPQERANLDATYRERFGRPVSLDIKGTLSARDAHKADLLLKQGALQARQKAELAMQGFGTREEELFAAISEASSDERKAMRQDSGFMKNLADELSGPDYERVDTLLKNGSLTREEQLHFAMAGLGTDEAAIHAALDGLSFAERAAVQTRYAQKYQHPLAQDLKAELGQRDLWAANDALQAPASCLRERIDRAEAKAARERNSGSIIAKASDGLMDVISDKGFAIDQGLREYHHTVRELKSGADVSAQKAAQLVTQEQDLAIQTAQYLQQKQEVAETTAQIATMAAAATATAATGGLATPLAMAIVATSAGATKVATKQLIVGDSYELTGAEGAKDFAIGAAEGLSSFASGQVGKKLTATLGKQVLAARGQDVGKKGIMFLGLQALHESGSTISKKALTRAGQAQLQKVGEQFIGETVARRVAINAAIGGAKGAVFSASRAAARTALDDKTNNMEFSQAVSTVLKSSAQAAVDGAKSWAVGSAAFEVGTIAAESAMTQVYMRLGMRLAGQQTWSEKKILSAAYEAVGEKSKGLSHEALVKVGQRKLYADLGEQVVNRTTLGRVVSVGAKEVITRGAAANPRTLLNSLGDHDTWQYGVDSAFGSIFEDAGLAGAKDAAAFGSANVASELAKGMKTPGGGAARAGLTSIVWRTIASM